MNSRYRKAIEYIYNLNKFGMKLGLKNITGLLSIFDNPHLKIKVIHIAGTNGKGSTAAVLHSILQKANYKAGLYTSPHLVDFQERMKINDEYITQDEVCDLLERLKPAIQKIAHTDGFQHPTFFEVITAMAYLYFYEKEVDFAIMEVGLGGRLDATNVCQPLISVITHIDFDHMAQLGNTLAEIAAEKGAIIKENAPVVCARQSAEADVVIKRIAQEKKTLLYTFGEEFNATLICSLLRGNHFQYCGIYNNYHNLFVPLVGEYQLENTSLAIAAAELLHNNGFNIRRDAIIEGVESSQWPGRFEIVREKPMIILDGGHNPNGINQFMENLKRLIPNKKIIAVLGIFQDKDYRVMVKTVVSQVNQVIITMADNPRATPASLLAEEARRYIAADKIIETTNVKAAIDQAIRIAQEEDVICITGSLYTVGEAESYFLKKVRKGK